MTYRFGPFAADRTTYRVCEGARDLDLTPKLLDLLFYLLEHPAALVTKEELLDRIWPVDGPIDDVFTLQDGIVVAFSRALGVPAAAPPRIRSRETPSLEAYRAYTEGWLKVESFDTGLVDAAIRDFERAIAGCRRRGWPRPQTRRSTHDPRTLAGWLYWTPRVLGLLAAGFTSLFALDALTEGLGVWGTVGALALHLIPTAVVLAALAVAWRWEVAGGLLFVLAGVAYALRVDARAHLDWMLVIAGPLWVVGGLFLLSGLRTGSGLVWRRT